MRKVIFVKPFKFSPNGFDVTEYEPSADPVEVSDECAQIAVDNEFAADADPNAKKSAKKPGSK